MKNYFFYLLFLLLLLGNPGVKAQPVPVEQVIKLEAQTTNSKRLDKLTVKYSFSPAGSMKYKVRVETLTFNDDVSIGRRDDEFIVRADSLDHNFNKTDRVEAILHYFYINSKNFSNYNNVKKQLNQIFGSALEDVKYDIEREKAIKKVEGIEK